jgi:hypothetical protein
VGLFGGFVWWVYLVGFANFHNWNEVSLFVHFGTQSGFQKFQS